MASGSEPGSENAAAEATARVGYKSPPLHSRFRPGQSGNPSGRRKGSKNLRTLINEILDEEVSMREGADIRKVSKAEAILRTLVVDALKGDQRRLSTLFRLAEQAGLFEESGQNSEIRFFITGADANP